MTSSVLKNLHRIIKKTKKENKKKNEAIEREMLGLMNDYKNLQMANGWKKLADESKQQNCDLKVPIRVIQNVFG